MKYFLALLVLALTLISCSTKGIKPTWPAGAKLCSTDWDCGNDEYCGFVPGYTAAVCRYSPGVRSRR